MADEFFEEGGNTFIHPIGRVPGKAGSYEMMNKLVGCCAETRIFVNNDYICPWAHIETVGSIEFAYTLCIGLVTAGVSEQVNLKAALLADFTIPAAEIVRKSLTEMLVVIERIRVKVRLNVKMFSLSLGG